MDHEKAGRKISFDEFVAQNNLALEIGERNLPKGHPARFYARLKGCCISEPPLLKTVFGNGETKKESIEELATQIESKTLVIDEGTPQRRDIVVPKFRK